ncbi:hypothetical protein ACRRHK_004800, partial [Vibrio fluvialis]
LTGRYLFQALTPSALLSSRLCLVKINFATLTLQWQGFIHTDTNKEFSLLNTDLLAITASLVSNSTNLMIYKGTSLIGVSGFGADF